MIRARSLALDVRYNNAPFAGQVGGEIESLTYIDSAADNSDSIDITLDAQDGKWLRGVSQLKGRQMALAATLYVGEPPETLPYWITSR